MQSNYAPRSVPSMVLTPEVRATLGRTASDVHQSLTFGAKALLALNAKSARTGSPIFSGIPATEKARRRAKGKVAKASRKTNRSAR